MRYQSIFQYDGIFWIYVIVSYYNCENIRYLLWNRDFFCSLKNTHTIFLTPCIRCTNHLCDSCGLTDVNPHFVPSMLPMIQNVDLLWRHRYKSWPPAFVTQWPIVPVWFLWTFSYHNDALCVEIDNDVNWGQWFNEFFKAVIMALNIM